MPISVVFAPSQVLPESFRAEATDYTVKPAVSIGNLMILRIVARVVAGVMSIW